MPDNYPDEDCPLVVFEPSIFHPLINIETGELDVKRGFQKWRYRNYENEMWVLKPTMPLIFITIHYLQTKCGKVTALPSKEENELK
ncbi:protein AKTIP homolog isoform X3 [Tachypleus tridentatus]|uniref:protein AKTIP homolog isoform X3 n=1 Tax=Tachypleus tridentatus TaxID=6853 RepID=UPI003FD4B1E6